MRPVTPHSLRGRRRGGGGVIRVTILMIISFCGGSDSECITLHINCDYYRTKSCEDINECASNRGGCEQICKNSPGSYRCACRDGYKLRQKTRCLDIDECAEGAHQCQHNCTNGDGRYSLFPLFV